MKIRRDDDHLSTKAAPSGRMDGAIVKLDAAYRDYIKLLEAEANELMGLAWTHGWESSRVEEGKRARERIDEVRKELGLEINHR